MSKAFTREDDAEQGSALPERPIPPQPNLVTSEGLAQIDAAVARLSEQHTAARGAGHADAANLARDLRYWTARQATAQLTQRKPGPQVQFGSRGTLKRQNGSMRTFRIVGTDEADPTKGTLSYVSPLAQALMGKEIGDTITIGGNDEEIVDVT
jgi:transcription elongation GreA/GreB family factor